MAAFPLSEIARAAAPIGILDVGASFVESAPPYQALMDAGSARLIGFEPDPAECEKLRGLYGPPHAFFPFFIGDGAPATFYETNWAATGSLYKPNRALLERFQEMHELMTLVAEHPVQTRRLDDIEGVGDVDFFKLDVQGAELKVLQGGERVLAGATVVQAEVEFLELYEGQPMFADVDRYLRGRGFVFHTFYGGGFGTRCFKPLALQDHPYRGINQLLWGDAVYVRDWMKLDALPADKLLRYATLIHDVFASQDLCLHLLEQLDARAGTRHSADYRERLAEPA